MKKINIKDIPYTYEYDEITCFEHPLIAIMEYINKGTGRYYAMLSKMFGTYYQLNVREKILMECENKLGFRMKIFDKFNYKKIKESLCLGIPVVVAVNLKDIYYSEYYMKKDWVHWILVKGYSDKGKLLYVLDNLQYSGIGHEYGDFCIPYKMLIKANKSYRKKYGNEYSVIEVQSIGEKNKKEIFNGIVCEYLKIKMNIDSNYRQFELLNMYQKGITLENISADFQIEFKKKILNINKYRKLFFLEIEKEMLLYNYHDRKIQEYILAKKKILKLWENYILKNLALKNHFEDNKVRIELKKSENSIQLMIKDFVDYLSEIEKKDDTSCYNIEKYLFENNEEQIIKCKYNEDKSENITFNFTGKKIYNWWDMDDAPKVILDNIDLNLQHKFEISKEILIDEKMRKADSNYEVGIFIRNIDTKESIIFGIKNGNSLIVDKIGKYGQEFEINNVHKCKIYLSVDYNILKFGMVKNDKKNLIWQEENEGNKYYEVGLVCKTWGKSADLCVKFIG